MNYTAQIQAAERNGLLAVAEIRLMWASATMAEVDRHAYEAWHYAMRAARFGLMVLGRDE